VLSRGGPLTTAVPDDLLAFGTILARTPLRWPAWAAETN
jgi:hypothetical protein